MDVTSISENLLFVTVKINTEDEAGNQGSGTGFIFSHEFEGQTILAIVTNKHVIKDAIKGGITFIKRKDDKPLLGESFTINFDQFEKQWHGHPNPDVDIAITNLIPLLDFMKTQHNVDVFFKSLSSQNIPNEEQIKEIDALEEIVFVGYPNGLWDSKNFTPIIRKGTTATPFSIDFEGQKKFIIDASVFGGSSGSPVLLLNSGIYAKKSGGAIAGTRFNFLGVVAAVFFKKSINEIISVPIPTSAKDIVVDKEMIDLGVVYKASTVVETIENAMQKQA